MFHRRIGINSAVTDGLIVALLLLGEDILLSIQGFVLNFVRELIPNNAVFGNSYLLFVCAYWAVLLKRKKSRTAAV